MLKTACGNGFPLNIPSEIPTGGGSGGTSDYSELSNKPSINSVTLSGNKTAEDLGLASADIEDLIPADASSSNQLVTEADLPGLATTSAPGTVQPDGTTITITDGVISAAGGGSGLSFIETDSILLNDLTWSGTGDEMRSAILTDAIPANVKVISIALIGFGYLGKTNIFQYTQSGVSPRNIIILAPDNTFQQYASIKLRITCIPAT